jgi:hypothetical protein
VRKHVLGVESVEDVLCLLLPVPPRALVRHRERAGMRERGQEGPAWSEMRMRERREARVSRGIPPLRVQGSRALGRGVFLLGKASPPHK